MLMLRRGPSRLTYAMLSSDIGVKGVVKKIRDRVGDNPVYITLDIDVVDPSFAPATGSESSIPVAPRANAIQALD